LSAVGGGTQMSVIARIIASRPFVLLLTVTFLQGTDRCF
jgi:hypothetical protein